MREFKLIFSTATQKTPISHKLTVLIARNHNFRALKNPGPNNILRSLIEIKDKRQMTPKIFQGKPVNLFI